MIRTLSLCLLAAVSTSAWAADGLPDSSFGILGSGKNVIALNLGGSNSDSTVDVLVGANRSIFIVGTARAFPGQSRFAITKLTPNGIVDPSFGSNGTVYSATANLEASRARLDAAGNIVVVGTASYAGSDKDFYICRYSQQGQSVAFSAWGSNCRSVAFDRAGGNLTDEARDFRIDSSGRIIIVGSAGVSATSDFTAVTRITAAGEIDATFSNLGKDMRQFVPNVINRFYGLAQRSDGKFYAVGEAGDSQSANGTDALLARLTVIGNPDPSYQSGTGFSVFGSSAGALFHRDDVATSVEVLTSGRILIAGFREIGSGADEYASFIYKFVPVDIVGFDASFGQVGTFEYTSGYSARLNKLLVQSDGKIVAVGSRKLTSTAASLMHVIRLLPDGTFDATQFGTIGRVNVDFFLADGANYGIAAASQDGSLLIAGHSPNQNALDLDQTVTRLHNDLIFAEGLE